MENEIITGLYKVFLTKRVLMSVKKIGKRYDVTLHDLTNDTYTGISAYFNDVLEYLQRKLILVSSRA